MSMLDGFEILETISGIPTMSVTKNGVSFNKAALEKLGCPQYVITMIDKLGCRFAIVKCEVFDRGARSFVKPGRDIANGVRWNNHDLRTTLEELMGWDLTEMSWKITGKYSEQDQALIFDLREGERQELKGTNRKGALSGGGFNNGIPL